MKKIYLLLFLCFISIVSFGQGVGVNLMAMTSSTLPAGWAITSSGGSWTVSSSDPLPPYAAAHSGSYWFNFESYSYGVGSYSVLNTPAFSLTGRGAALDSVTVWIYRDASYCSAENDRVQVWINTSSGLGGATSMGVVNRAGGMSTSGGVIGTSTTGTSGWYQYIFIIPTSFTGATNYILFEAISDFGADVNMDDIHYTTYPCAPPVAGSISGNTPVCGSGGTLTLTDATATAGGTWTTSNAAVAGINASTGFVTTAGVGTSVVKYTVINTCGGANVVDSTTVIVNPVPAAIISSASSICSGLTASLADGVSGGTWTSSNSTVATIGSSGALTGVGAGTANITYRLPAGCYVTTSETVLPLPAVSNVIGGGTFCPGGTGADIGLSGSATGINYQVYNSGTLSGMPVPGTGTSLDLGFQTASGTYTVVATNATSFCTSNMMGSAIVVANPLPSPIMGVASACVGLSSTLTDGTAGGTWSTTDAAVATIGVVTGNVTGIVAGTVIISYTLSSTGCKIGVPFVVNPLPAAIGGSSNVCVGATTTLTDGTGGTWSSGSTAVATIGSATGTVTGVGSGTSVITYTSTAGCIATTPILVSPLPVAYAVTGGGSFCAGGSGVHVGLVYSSSGVSYQLYNGGVVIGPVASGSNSGLSFGSQTAGGTYTATATSTISGCTSSMTGSVSVIVNPAPGLHSITGGGSFCSGTAGVPLGTDGSDTGVKYQLFNGSSSVGAPVTGTGSGLSFGSYTIPGTYTVTATNIASGCGAVMSGSSTISVNVSPNVYTVGGGGGYCTGGGGKDITLSGSDLGVTYNLASSLSGSAGTFSGTGGPLDLGFQTGGGVYTVTATGGTGCTSMMSGSATIVIEPLPLVNNVTGTGSYCAGSPGVHVGLDYSNTGIEYVLMYYGSAIDTFPGTGSGLDFGTEPAGVYTVFAINPSTLCGNNMNGTATISINALPNTYSIVGGGSYCAGSSGPDISLGGSDPGVNYQLFRGTTPVGAPLAGTGTVSLDFGDFTTAGVYTIVGTNPVTLCSGNMIGSATIAANTLPAAYLVTGGGNYCIGGTGVPVLLSGSGSSVKYELFLGGTTSTGIIVPGTGTLINFGDQTLAGNYTVVATDTASGCIKDMAGSATININSGPPAHNVTGGGNYCVGGSGAGIGLDGSNTGINYQLTLGAAGTGSSIAGSGGAIAFGLQTTTGTYNVLATNPLTGCTSVMTGTASIGTIPLPNPYPVAGGGNYCLGGTGSDIFLAGGGSDPGVNYQLYLGSLTVGGPILSATGGAIDFGPQTGEGIYKVIATNSLTSCVQNMPGSVTVHAVSPSLFTVTGGGNYCLGDTGVHVNLMGSSAGVSYQLYVGLVMVDTAVPGTGSAIDFGAQTGVGDYTVIATTTSSPSGCTRNMVGIATISVNALPAQTLVTGGGTICGGVAGPHVGVLSSIGGINYQLYNGTTAVGAPLGGSPSSSGLDFGPQDISGIYTVIATDPVTTCKIEMLSSAVVSVHPSPNAYPVTISNSGNYCAIDSGVHIGIANSDAGVNYQLYRGVLAVNSPVAGTGVALDMGLDSVAGTYAVVGVDASSGCTSDMAGTVIVHIIPLPTVFNVTGGGNYCAGGEGVHVGLDGSQVGEYYQVYDGSLSAGTLFGTGYPLDFGLETATGTYNIIANSVVTNCPNNMFGDANIAFDSILTPVVTIVAYPGNNVGVWHIDSMKAFVTNGGATPTYQWYVNGHLITGATSSTFVGYSFFNNDDVSCIVTSSGICGGLSATGSLVLNLHNVAGVATINTGASDIKLTPNPNKGAFTIKGTVGIANADEEVLLEVTNMLGQVVYSNNIQVQNGIIDQQVQLGNSIANGMYILNLHSGTGNAVFHFVIEQ